jgi:membrane associated rhomboid family serine protease
MSEREVDGHAEAYEEEVAERRSGRAVSIGEADLSSRVIIPLGTDRPLQRRTVVNHVLIGLNVLVFAALAIAGIQSERGVEGIDGILDRLSLSWIPSEPWRFFTYAFVHDMTSPWHLAGNLLFLWVFGPNVEDRLGRVGYPIFYLLAGAAAGLAHVATSPYPVIGASGAVAGVTGAYLILFPRTQVRVFFFLFLVGVFNLSAVWFMALALARDLAGAMFQSRGGVAWFAHLGGYAFGMGVSFALLATRILPSETFDMFHLYRQWRRRVEIRSATQEHTRRTGTAMVAPGKDAELSELQRPVADARAEISRRLTSGDLPGAAAGYRSLVEKYGLIAGAATMSRRHQLDLANHFFATGDHSSAVVAYEKFAEAYPRDAETTYVKLMLALISARYVRQPMRARALLDEIGASLRTAEEREIAAELRGELDGPQTPGDAPAGGAVRDDRGSSRAGAASRT